MSVTPAAQTLSAATPQDNEVPLKQAAQLVAKNERTLRRKLDDGTLKGRKKLLETGGELWLVDYHSLVEVFGDAATPPAAHAPGAATPYDFDLPPMDYVEPPPTVLKSANDGRTGRDNAATPSDTGVTPPGGAVGQTEKSARTSPDLTEFLIKEHASLKDGHHQEITDARVRHREELASLQESLQQRDSRISTLQDQNGLLRQELGEVRGRADTEAKMREWLQHQLEQVRHQLAPPQAPYVNQEPADRSGAHVIDIDSRSTATPTATKPLLRKYPPAGAIIGFILFLLVGGFSVAYSLGLLGVR